ncbi:MAG TPA: metallophosphoesterase [bacterium]|nr:metallophosphoesterase [bacterium]HPN30060.1 metallophosphoesterase [bacterium]
MIVKASCEEKLDFNINAQSIIVCGDPGCDGYNTETVIIFEKILRLKADLTFVTGDIVPIGSEKYFNQAILMINKSAANPVFCLPGNHDLENYEKYFGEKNYVINAKNFSLIALDNSKRFFDEKALFFLETILNETDNDNIFVSFHIPPPNPCANNNITTEEWNKIKSLLDKHKEKIKYIFCGHIHSAVDYILDGYRIIITGGGGSAIDKSDNHSYDNISYHYFKLNFVNNDWLINMIEIPVAAKRGSETESFSEDENLVAKNLNDAFSREIQTFRKYEFFAEIAASEGYPEIAKLFKSAAKSEYLHSKLMFLASFKNQTTRENLKKAIQWESEEIDSIYADYLKISEKSKSAAAFVSILAAFEAEKEHLNQFKNALEHLDSGSDLPQKKYYICSRCGYLHQGDRPLKLCPGCGANMFKFS